METDCFLNLRYEGTDTGVMTARPSDNDFASALQKTYLREFGFDLSDRKILVDDIRVRARSKRFGLKSRPIARATGCTGASGNRLLLF